jgi:hypothetical protein
VTKHVFIDAINESGVAVANQIGAILPDGGSFWSWATQPAGTRTDRRVERARIDASGNLLVGGTTGATNRRLSVVGGHIFNSTNNDHLYGNFNEAADTAIWEVRSAQTKNANFGFVEAGVAERWAVGIKGGDASLIFASGSANIATATERARIDGSGNLLVGMTSSVGSYKLQVYGGAFIQDSAGNTHLITDGGNGFTYLPQVYHKTTAGAANVHVGSSPGDMYRSTSAAKYKTNIRPLENCLSVVTNMVPVRYNSLCESDPEGKDYIGFVADNEEANVPELVVKNADGEVEGFAYDRVTALLVAALKELKAEVDSLRAQLNP